MIVDWLRNGYSTKFKFFPADLTRDSDVTWYRAPAGALNLPFYNRFSSSNYAPDHSPIAPQVGEIVGEPHVWYNGDPLESYAGEDTCTDADTWEDGSPGPGADFDRDACCEPPPVNMLWELWSGGDAGQGFGGIMAPGAGGQGGNYVSYSVPEVSGQQWTITVGNGGNPGAPGGGGTVVQPTIPGPPVIFCGRTGSFPAGQFVGGAGGAVAGGNGGGGGSSAGPGGNGVAAVNQPGAVGGAGQGNGGNGGIRVPLTNPTVGVVPGGGGGGKAMNLGQLARSGANGQVVLTDSAGVHTFLVSGTYTVP